MRFGMGMLGTPSTTIQDGDQVYMLVTDDTVADVLALLEDHPHFLPGDRRVSDPLARLRDTDPRRDSSGVPAHVRRTTRQGRADPRLMAFWDRLGGLDLTLEEVGKERRSLDVSTQFTRVTTTVVFGGRGETGRGEDVTYTAEDHEWFPALEAPGP